MQLAARIDLLNDFLAETAPDGADTIEAVRAFG